MADRLRVSVTLHEPWLVFLRWLAAERAELPAELARTLIETGLERIHADPALHERYERWVHAGGDLDLVAQDIVRALGVEGVPAVLSGQTIGVSEWALQAARYLQMISLWLADPRAAVEKGGPPRLEGTGWRPIPGAGVGEALARVGGADGAGVRAAAQDGRLGASDKRELSDSGPREGAGGGHARAR